MLKHLSIPELNFSESWKIGWDKINRLSKLDKYMTLFWFLGPFIYLIERDPADLWLTLICVIFLIRCIKRKDWIWVNQIWFKSALALWILGLFSAITGPDPLFSFQQGFVWIRFPLYAAAAQVWLAKDRDIRILMLLCILFGMLIMCGILIAETIIEPKTRLTWPYGDLVPGGYISKISLPLFCVLMAIAVSKKSNAGLFSGFIGLLSIGVSVLTGERTNFLIRACGGILASIVWKPKFIMFSLLVLIEIMAVLIVFFNRPDLSNRFVKQFVNSIPIVNTSDNNPYWGAWRGGIQQGILNPIKGVGPSGTRNTCVTLDTSLPKWLPGKNYCGNHPHNFYIQLFSEVGIIGLLIGCIMFGSIITSCYKARLENFNCPMAATAFVVPLGLFFPIQQFNSFYGQWNNLFIWFAIAFAISQYQGWRNNKSFKKNFDNHNFI
ncbi:O-antigen ligase family protein [Alphaproteobacteria bacterium]|nr:O-antigen ligase family protein [Alphaproteobacteria bacterium]